MAKSILVPINLNGNEIQNFLVQVLATAPTGAAGRMYFNSADNKLYYHNGTSWVDITASTDTKNTAGATDTSSKIYIIGATAQDANPQTYSHDTAYVGTDGKLYSNSKEVVNLSDPQALSNKTYEGYTLGDASAKGVDTSSGSISASSTDSKVPTSKLVYDYVSSAISAADAMRFKGTIGTGGTITTLPTSGVKVGDTYRVITAGTYAGEACEIGDLIIALTTTPTWTVAQTNIDGAITTLTAGDGMKVSGSGSSRTLATKLQEGTVTLTASQTSTTASVTDMVGYTAFDASTGEEVIVSATQGSSAVTFSIAAAYTNNITIKYLYMTT